MVKRRKKKAKSSSKPLLKMSLIAGFTGLGVAGVYGYQSLTESPKRAEVHHNQPSKAWYLQQAKAPEMITLPDTPLILAPAEAEIDETIEIVAPLPSEKSKPPTISIAEEPSVPKPLKPTPRLDNVEVAIKPSSPLVAYEEPLSSEVHSPEPTIRVPVIEPVITATIEQPKVEPAKPTFEERFEKVPYKPRWAQHAVDFKGTSNNPMIALVIDDLGLDRKRTEQTLALSGPMTMAFIPYAKNLEKQTSQAKALGHELMLHMPMEPLNSKLDAGPNHLNTKLNEEGLKERLHWNLERFDGYVGVNNHMGSRATTDPKIMEALMTELRTREMLFLDSRTNPASLGAQMAKEIGVPFVERNVFLDNENDLDYVLNQLRLLENVSKKRGYAIGIGHPRDATIAALEKWLPSLENKGFSLVPISQIILKQEAKS